MIPSDAEIEAVMRELGLDRMQAIRHIQSRRLALSSLRHRRMIRDFQQ